MRNPGEPCHACEGARDIIDKLNATITTLRERLAAAEKHLATSRKNFEEQTANAMEWKARAERAERVVGAVRHALGCAGVWKTGCACHDVLNRPISLALHQYDLDVLLTHPAPGEPA